MFSRLHRAQKGFTLVELLVVIGIIGILAMLLLPQFRGMRDRARASSCQSNLKNLGTQLEVYYVDNDTYPTAAQYTTYRTNTLKKLGECSLSTAAAVVTYTYREGAVVGVASGAAIYDTMGAAAAAGPFTTYLAFCPSHDGAGGAATAATPYPHVVQLYVTPEGVKKNQAQ